MDKMYKAEGKLRKSSGDNDVNRFRLSIIIAKTSKSIKTNDENPINRNLFYFFFINFIEIRLKYKINF